MIAELRRVLSAGAEFQTTGYSLEPKYRQSQRDARRIVGYTASNTVRVTTDDLASVGKIIDVATASGANQISDLRFTLKDEEALHAQALRAAVANAKRNAEAIASGLGLKLGQILSVEEGSPRWIPRVPRALSAETITIEPETIDLRAQVTIRVELVP
ncbi:MAG: SIMPL domain-containing protein [Bryobacteraceae bacterium]|nr:SIMPL domain-containing protein [Bryobacteraceae bacterium]